MAASGLGRRVWDLRGACRILSSCIAWAPESGNRQVSWLWCSGLSCSMKHGILVPWQGSTLSPALEGGFLTTGPPRKSPFWLWVLFWFLVLTFVFMVWKFGDLWKQVSGLKRSCFYWVKDNRESDLLVIAFLSQSTLRSNQSRICTHWKEYSSFVSLYFCVYAWPMARF